MTAFEVPGFSWGQLVAASDLSASQYCGVTTDATYKVRLSADAGVIIGVLQNKPKSGEACTIVSSGITFMIAAAAITGNDGGTPVKCDATGKVVEQGGTGVAIGFALSDASGAGEIIPVLLTIVAA